MTKYLLSNLNDNVHQNLISVASPQSYNDKKRFPKKEMSTHELYEFIDDELSKLNEKELKYKLYRAVDKILLAHKNSKIFLLLMSGPVLITLYIIKYALKLLVIYYLFKKKPTLPNNKKEEILVNPTELKANAT